MLNLQPEGLESVEVEKKLLEECDQSVWYALSIADSREELLARKEKLANLTTVERVDEIASLLSGDEEVKTPLITQIGRRLEQLPERPPQIPLDRLDARVSPWMGAGQHDGQVAWELLGIWNEPVTVSDE